MMHWTRDTALLAALACLLAVAVQCSPEPAANTTLQKLMEIDDDEGGTAIQPSYPTEFARSVAKLEEDILDTLAGFVVGVFSQISTAWASGGDTNGTAAPDPPKDPRLLKII